MLAHVRVVVYVTGAGVHLYLLVNGFSVIYYMYMTQKCLNDTLEDDSPFQKLAVNILSNL